MKGNIFLHRFNLFSLIFFFLLLSCKKDPDPGTELVVEPFTELDKAIAGKMTLYNIPALAIAITRNEKLVYVHSYGFADKETSKLASNNDLYRIASISKPITVIAILNLVQDGLLTLDQKVFGSDGILGNEYGTAVAGSNKDLVTVRNLLDHRSGWTNTPNDPMFSDVTLTQTQLISNLVMNRPLTSTPGTSYYYLNIGYCILGRVIEKITNQTYENYVRVLATEMGITEIKIGGNTLIDRLPKEVKYYQNEFSPYAINVKRMDAAGGWVASATDLARFVVSVDRKSYVPDIISPTLLNQFYFGYFNWYHYGSLPGTSAVLERVNDTYNYVVLVNTRTEYNYDVILEDLKNTVSTQISTVSDWPEQDLFY